MFPIFQSILGTLGKKTVPVREMTKNVIGKRKLDNNPQWDLETQVCGEVEFTGLQLAHAVVKADFLDESNPLLPGIGFVLSTERFIDWNNPDFSLKDGATEIFGDFVKNSLIGRVGQGLTILFSQSMGYAFMGHLSIFLVERGFETRKPSGEQLPIADFVCENALQELAIFESKASTRSGPYDVSRTKSLLKEALKNQVEKWVAEVPRARRGYAVCSHLKEASATEASAIVFADPEVDKKNIDERADATIRRMNYAAWLSAMGLQGPAMRLLHHRGEPEWYAFDVFKLGDVEVGLLEACREWRHPRHCLGSQFGWTRVG